MTDDCLTLHVRRWDVSRQQPRSICIYLKLKQIPKSLKGANGNARLCDLYSKARKIYSKGYTAREMISSLNFSLIRDKRQPSLLGLEKALGVQQTPQ